MRRLEPLFTARVQEGGAPLRPVSFRLESELGSVGMEVGRRRVRVGAPTGKRRVYVPKRWLSGLITGYYGPRDIASRKGVVLPDSLLPALEVLFPRGWPFIYAGDNY